MPETDTQARLPVPLAAPAPRPSLARSHADAAFVGHLLAARDRLPPQRARRNASVEAAIGSYTQGARIAVRRMPQGYRKNLTA
ncbi:hypothetical protein IC608_16565 [Devosia sp. PTR5]|uniref:Uncharacterized protein n=1 Tax=Devosia oryzisoli TaxID=2774138 RepID=A0A927FVG7_9HYPH|nr:hypothetical protein [Devosia oryzisoli]MBD8067085.1 hypothetical protein [Devosia oryzisoli]